MKLYDTWTAVVAGALALGSPRRAANYRQHRELYRAYAAGELTGNNMRYRPRSRSGEADNRRAAKWLTARVREQAANNSYISGGIERICNNVIRRGIRPQFRFARAGKQDKERNDWWEGSFARWARVADLTGHDSYWSLQKLGLRHLWIDGQYLIHRTFDDTVPGVCPLRLELLEMDMLDQLVDGVLANGNIARRGIEYDPAKGRPIAYHILTHHPGDYLPGASTAKSVRYLAEDIIHVWDRRRISQYSGISWLAAVVLEAYDMAEYRNFERQGAKTAAAFAAFVHSSYPEFRLGPQLPPGGLASPPSTDGTVQERPTEIEGGRIQYLPDGTQITLASHARPGNSYEPFIKDSQLAQSVGFGMSYEAFSNNYSGASWSSARAGSLEERLSYQGQQYFLNEHCNDRVMGWFVEAMYLAGLARGKGLDDYARNPLAWQELVTWQEPGWHWVDPRNEAAASQIMIREVLDTRSAIAGRRGEDWDQIVEGQIEEEQRLRELYELRRENQLLQEELNNAPKKEI
ncbi:MAG: phage portal protein [Desulfobulbaceae bacterium]